MSKPLSFVPVPGSQLEVGQALRWPIYDWDGNLLLAAGSIVQSESQLAELTKNGFFHNPKWDESLTQSRLVAPVMARNTEKNSSAKKNLAEEKDSSAPSSRETSIELDDVQWVVGETLYLQLLDSPGIRYTVKLIGYVKNQSILITSPQTEGKFEFIREGQNFIVRAFPGKNAYAFVASALKTVYTPHPYLHLAYPKEVLCNTVRQSLRAQVNIVAAISIGEGGATRAIVLNDLSVGGAGGNTREEIGGKGETGKIKFKLTVEGHDHYLDLDIVLRSCEVDSSNPGFRCGFQFTSLNPQEKAILSAFVHQAIVEAI